MIKIKSIHKSTNIPRRN